MGVLCCYNETQPKVVFTVALTEKSHTPNALAGVRAVLGLPVKTAGKL